MERGKFRLIQYPTSRLGTIDLGRIGGRKHHVAGLIEIDVTDALRTEGPVFFFAWIVGMIGRCIAEDRSVHALHGRGNTLVLFDDVDITVIVEKKVEGYRVPLPLVLRRVNGKSVREIHQEIRDAQRQPVQDEGDYVLSGGAKPERGAEPEPGAKREPGAKSRNGASARAMRLFYRLPGSIRVAIIRLILRNPFRARTMMGTVVVTSIGSVGRLPGWVIPRSMHNLCFALGSVIRKPWVVDDRVEIREILHMTVLFDHDVVDGAPAARFMINLVERLEGRGPKEQAPDPTPGAPQD